MLPIVAMLVKSGLSLAANAVLTNGPEWFKEKTGIDISSGQMTSEDITKVKQWELNNVLELEKLRQQAIAAGFDIERAYLSDTQSARQMQVAALGQEDKFAKRFVYYFATVWSIATMAYIGCITFLTIPKDNIRYADTILGFLLGTLIAQIFNYMYGTTRGSESKNAVIKDVVHASIK